MISAVVVVSGLLESIPHPSNELLSLQDYFVPDLGFNVASWVDAMLAA